MPSHHSPAVSPTRLLRPVASACNPPGSAGSLFSARGEEQHRRIGAQEAGRRRNQGGEAAVRGGCVGASKQSLSRRYRRDAMTIKAHGGCRCRMLRSTGSPVPPCGLQYITGGGPEEGTFCSWTGSDFSQRVNTTSSYLAEQTKAVMSDKYHHDRYLVLYHLLNQLYSYRCCVNTDSTPLLSIS